MHVNTSCMTLWSAVDERHTSPATHRLPAPLPVLVPRPSSFVMNLSWVEKKTEDRMCLRAVETPKPNHAGPPPPCCHHHAALAESATVRRSASSLCSLSVAACFAPNAEDSPSHQLVLGSKAPVARITSTNPQPTSRVHGTGEA
jgi:hypothetical protein